MGNLALPVDKLQETLHGVLRHKAGRPDWCFVDVGVAITTVFRVADWLANRKVSYPMSPDFPTRDPPGPREETDFVQTMKEQRYRSRFLFFSNTKNDIFTYLQSNFPMDDSMITTLQSKYLYLE